MIRKNKVDYSLYVITDPFLSRGRKTTEIVGKAIEGGATIIQFRDKRGLSARSLIEETKKIQELTSKAKIPLIINDRLDIALATKADGLHLGQDDIPLPIARKYLRKSKIIGVSVRTVEEAQKAIEEGADYIAVSGVFPTTTKLDTGKPLGLDIVKQVAAMSDIPVIGIGGIHIGNAGSVIQAGADGIAVISAVVAAVDPAAAVRSLKLAIKSARSTQ